MEIKESVSLAGYTSFKIGGPSRYLGIAKSQEELLEFLRFAKNKNIPFLILGKGSNVLISDNGYSGLAIINQSKGIKIEDREVVAEGGISLAELIEKTKKSGLYGLEWSISIPGTLGGAIRGNAGAFGSEIKDFIEEVKVYNYDKDEFSTLKNRDCKFAYRYSIFKEKPNFIILEAKLKLNRNSNKEGENLIKDYLKKRNSSQDLSYFSAGCIFKNIPWSRKDINKEELVHSHPELKAFTEKPVIPAGFLIDYLGLKGFEIGEAMISKKHGNFIINKEKARAEDVIMLIGLIKERVHRHYDLQLEEEIQFVL